MYHVRYQYSRKTKLGFLALFAAGGWLIACSCGDQPIRGPYDPPAATATPSVMPTLPAATITWGALPVTATPVIPASGLVEDAQGHMWIDGTPIR